MGDGLQCPRCGCKHLTEPDGSPTTETTPAWKITKTERHVGFIRRKRVCRHCGKVVRTREVIERADLENEDGDE